ncbi:MAG TPA: glutathione S-transferase family protein [Casimicrobiaceae bacterium]
MLKILGRKTSSNVQKVLWCCSELGIPFEREDVGGPFGRNNTPEYRALNPNGLVPTIDDDGFILWESNAIVRYLCAKHGVGSLWPTEVARRADADRWMDWQQTTLAPPMGILFRGLLKQPPDVIDAEQMNGAMQKAAEAFRILDTQLARHSFVAGDALTMGDIALGNAAHRWFTLPRERPEMLHVGEWYARLNTRPAYRQHIATV